METLLAVLNFIWTNGPALITAIVSLLTAIIGIALIIPGPQPEGWLTKVRDFLAGFSRK